MGRIGGFAKPSMRSASVPLNLHMDAALIVQVRERESERAREIEVERSERYETCVLLNVVRFA
jgi:hypothetical protein